MVAVAKSMIKVPKWAQNVSYLHSFAKGRHLVVKAGGKFRVVFCSFGAPVGERWWRPYKLEWHDHYKLVTGQFEFWYPGCGSSTWAALEYNRGVKGFVFMSSYQLLELVYRPHPDVKYYLPDESREIEKQIKERRTWSDDEHRAAEKQKVSKVSRER
ncbi:MAG: hypothetical protein ABIK07_22195 [Planctomycetota bacterium]